MKEIYIVRHGETEWNALGKYQGWSDVPLNERGRAQAEACAERLESVEFHTIVSSDLSRAMDTAKTIAKYQDGLDVISTEALREINFGHWESLTYDEIEASWPGEIHRMYQRPQDARIEGGESFLDVQIRAMKAVKEYVDALPDGERILFVCHGGTIRTIICAFLHIDLNACWNFRQGNTSVNIVNFYGDNSPYNAIELLNDTAHIRGV